MRFAVASQNFRTVTGHAGKTRRFLIFEATTGQPPQEVERFDLPKEQSIHAFRGSASARFRRRGDRRQRGRRLHPPDGSARRDCCGDRRDRSSAGSERLSRRNVEPGGAARA
ncbi:NifB/NifX family molybdenum-iron cluster-binding protein [Cereibacter changlensis]|uniref:NifB/NifX family molybdenum-iron cluster-binding protein n=1 Tax=Cereibacter changlensis TaxID=402884 RepID=UPI00200A002C|nr:hypothetical protein [Cereibacter changlensis]